MKEGNRLRAFIQYQLLNYIRSLKFIPSFTVFGVWIFILYAYKNVPILSSYAVSSIAIYLTMCWVGLTLFSLEEDSEKHILFAAIMKKELFLLGKWLTALILFIPLFLLAEFFPIFTNSFKGDVSLSHYGLSFYSHLLLALLGLFVAGLFSLTNFAVKRYAWLSAVFVLVVSLAERSIIEAFSFSKWILWIFPPALKVIQPLSGDDFIVLGKEFLVNLIMIIFYLIAGYAVLLKLFLKRHQ